MSKFVTVKKPVTEDDHQALVIMWAKSAEGKWPCLRWLYHIPNERKCTVIEGARLKRIGVKAGVSDLFLPYPCGGHHGLYIEMKTPDGRASDSQIKFVKAMEWYGYAAYVCKGYEAAIRVIKEYLGGGGSGAGADRATGDEGIIGG